MGLHLIQEDKPKGIPVVEMQDGQLARIVQWNICDSCYNGILVERNGGTLRQIGGGAYWTSIWSDPKPFVNCLVELVGIEGDRIVAVEEEVKTILPCELYVGQVAVVVEDHENSCNIGHLVTRDVLHTDELRDLSDGGCWGQQIKHKGRSDLRLRRLRPGERVEYREE